MTVPLGVVAPLAAIAISEGKAAIQNKNLNSLGYTITGYDTSGKFHMDRVMMTYGPIVVGLIAHKAANRFGVNRVLDRHNVPLVRI